MNSSTAAVQCQSQPGQEEQIKFRLSVLTSHHTRRCLQNACFYYLVVVTVAAAVYRLLLLLLAAWCCSQGAAELPVLLLLLQCMIAMAMRSLHVNKKYREKHRKRE